MAYWGDPTMESMGLSGQDGLCIFGRPYVPGRTEPIGLIRKNSDSVMSFSARSLFRQVTSSFSRANVLSCVETGPEFHKFRPVVQYGSHFCILLFLR